MTRHILTRLCALAIAAVLTVGCAEPGKSPLEPTARPVLAAKVQGALPLSQSDEGSMQNGAVASLRAQAPAGSRGPASMDSLGSELTNGKFKRFSGYVVSSGRRGPTSDDDDNSPGNNDEKPSENAQNSNERDDEPKEQW